MRFLLGSILLLATLSGGSQPAQAKEKKLKEPAPTYFNTRSFQSSCDAIWSAAMPLLTEVGLAPQSMDRQRGVASLRWAKGQNVGSGNKEDIKKFTTGYSGLWKSYEVFRIDTGILLATQESISCRVQLKLSFTALQRNASTGDQWYALESNNFLEQTLLDMIGQLALRNPGTTQSVVGSTAPALPATVSITSNPPGGDIEIDGKFVGSTPSKFELTPGKHEIHVKKSGLRDWHRILDLLAGANIALAAELIAGENEKPPVVPGAVTPTALPPTKSPSPVETVSQPATVVQATPPVIKSDHLKIVCSAKFSEVPFSSSRPERKTLACGEEAVIVSQSGQWTRVKTKDGVEGNVATRFLGN
jgi:PEGA domain